MAEQGIGAVMVSSLWPASLAHKARVAAAQQGLSRSELIRRAVALVLYNGNGTELEPEQCKLRRDKYSLGSATG